MVDRRRPAHRDGHAVVHLRGAPANPLSIGTHLVQLVVVDDSGNVSAPASRQVRVLDAQVPTAILDAPATVSVGRASRCRARGRSISTEQIVEYIWRLDARPPVAMISRPSRWLSIPPTRCCPAAHGTPSWCGTTAATCPTRRAPRCASWTTAPTAIIDAPDLVPFGADIEVSEGRSVDIGGRIARNTSGGWTAECPSRSTCRRRPSP